MQSSHWMMVLTTLIMGLDSLRKFTIPIHILASPHLTPKMMILQVKCTSLEHIVISEHDFQPLPDYLITLFNCEFQTWTVWSCLECTKNWKNSLLNLCIYFNMEESIHISFFSLAILDSFLKPQFQQ